MGVRCATMARVSVVTGVHLLAAIVAAITWVVVLMLPPRLRVLTPYLGWASGGTVVWALCVTSVKHEGIHPWHQIPWFPAIAFTTGALLLWAGWFTRPEWRPSRALTAMWIAAPAMILAARLVGGLDVRSALFVVNTVYCFSLLLAIAVQVARRAGDREPAPRGVARLILVAAVVTLIAEAFRLNITDVIVTVTLVVVVATTVRVGDGIRPRSESGTLIDDLGALVLVFDDQQRLVDLNAPARLFYDLRGVEPPPADTAAADLLGTDLADVDALSVTLRVGSDQVRLGGYVQRLPSDGTPPNGWVCLLRRSTRSGTEAPAPWARRTLMGRIPAHDTATGLLSTRAFRQALGEAAQGSAAATDSAVAVVMTTPDPTELADTASVVADAWESRPEAIAVGRSGRSEIGLVVRGLDEPTLTAWCDEVGISDRLLVATRAGSVAEAGDLVDAAAAELSRRSRA